MGLIGFDGETWKLHMQLVFVGRDVKRLTPRSVTDDFALAA